MIFLNSVQHRGRRTSHTPHKSLLSPSASCHRWASNWEGFFRKSMISADSMNAFSCYFSINYSGGLYIYNGNSIQDVYIFHYLKEAWLACVTNYVTTLLCFGASGAQSIILVHSGSFHSWFGDVGTWLP